MNEQLFLFELMETAFARHFQQVGKPQQLNGGRLSREVKAKKNSTEPDNGFII